MATQIDSAIHAGSLGVGEYLRPASDCTTDSEEWLVVADNDVVTQVQLSNQMLDAELAAEDTDTETDKGVGPEGKTEDVFARVERFESAHRDRDHRMRDDPFWIQPFFEIMESMSAAWDDNQPEEWKAKMKRQFQTDINLLSGCTGMCAEGWVCKAGCSRRSRCLQSQSVVRRATRILEP